MSYTALYRKWRPDTFEDVKGQEHIVKTLKNQIQTDRIGHAYLFCGTRGTGKTTIAKILAKAVNCKHPVNGSPCGECEVCKAIADGSSLNVIEIDAASNNGVDNIRQIKEEVSYRPTEGSYKVYIIDEVHMLSIGAFNALLKTLEEPPSYVIFILATTEAHKIPVTIMSRCQRYDFKRIPVDTIKDRLTQLTEAENVKVEERALRYIAKMADGAMRDALSLLDQCMAFYMEDELKYEDVLEVLGTVDTEVFSSMFRKIINGDVAGLITRLEEIILQGRDLTQFVADFTWYLRNLLMLKTTPATRGMLDMSEDNIKSLEEETYMADENAIMRYIRILSELSQSLKYATQKRVTVEVALIKMTRPQMEADMESVTERLRILENLVKEKEDIIALTALRPEKMPVVYEQNPVTGKETLKAKPTIAAVSEDIREVVKNWRGIVGQMDGIYQCFLRDMRLSVIENTLLMVTDNPTAYGMINSPKVMENLKTVIENTIGKTVAMELKMLEKEETFEDSFADVEEYVKMNITIED